MRAYQKPTQQQMRDWLAEVIKSRQAPPGRDEIVKQLWPDVTRVSVY